jgi:aminoglycoside 6'-N-acetyltransferase
MAWLMLPFGVLLLLFIISPWTDRKGWTKVRGNAGGAAGASLERFNAFQLGHQAALEYRQEVHDEEDGEGGRPRRRFFPGITDGSLTIRSLEHTPEDIAHLARWLSDERVLAYYEGRDNPHDEARVMQVFYAELPAEEVPCIVEWEGRPVGYIQFYPIDQEGLTKYGYAAGRSVFGTDQFIGEPDLWGQGIGTRMLRMMIAYLFELEGAEAVVVDPLQQNERAIRAYEKCGFRKVRALPEHEWHEGALHDAWLMEVTPETARPPVAPYALRW